MIGTTGMAETDTELTQVEVFRPGQLILRLIRSFFGFASHRVPFLILLFVVTALLEGTGILILLPMLHLLGIAGQNGDSKISRAVTEGFALLHLQPRLGTVLMLFAGVMIGQIILRQILESGNLRVENGYIVFLRERLYEAVLRSNWLFFSRQRGAAVTQALTDEIQRIGVGGQQLTVLLGSGLVVMIQVAITFALSPKLTALALGAGGLLLLVVRPLTRKSHALGFAAQSKRGEMQSAISEHLQSLKLARSHGREESHFLHFKGVIEAISEQSVKIGRIFGFSRAVYEAGAVLCLCFFLFASISYSHLSTAELLLFLFIFTRLLPRISNLQSSYHRISQMLPSFANVESLTAEFAGAEEPLIKSSLPVGRLELREPIQVDRVSFQYSNEGQKVIREVSFEIRPGKTVALCGPSGSGKSTLADLLLGLLTPGEGLVKVNGQSLKGERLQQWRQSVAYVSQDPFLFHDTIRANLSWSGDAVTEEQMWEALRNSAAFEMVNALPSGLDTIVGERGIRLSGGERQRLTLARALVRKPTFLLLDEATSSLDIENEKLIQSALQKLHGSLTVLIIAHRLSTVRDADTILVLKSGEMVEQGTWAELTQNQSTYFSKWAAATELT
ncbi:MAG: xenobiotic-transporting ATPase [Verrucomicrobiales bacterium]|nr:xenobiotic-transporting ATPase [Verrucomicrobiales bacterium]